MPLIHHELCFGCGRTNMFGLLVDVERIAAGAVAGRAFIKQDHQGATPRHAHDGVIATALGEAMSLAVGAEATLRRLELDLLGAAPVGAFLDLEAGVERRAGPTIHATAMASAEGQPVARARGSYA